MKRMVTLFFLVACTTNFSFAQIKIHVENLKAPTDTLPEENYKDAITTIVRPTNQINTPEYISRFDTGTGKFARILNPDAFHLNLIAKSKTDKPLTIATSHAFYDAMFEAYAHHRPFVLSPDMIWLLIAQGFAQHINNNAEELRHYFVQFPEKKTLVISNEVLNIHNPYAPWEKEAFPVFADSISHYTGKELMNILTNNFSTSTPVTIAASQITIMESMKAYFDYSVVIGCGIPDIVLEGTPHDWEQLRMKAQYLKKFELSWWIDKLDPILKNIVEASKGKVNKTFWRNMFKYHKPNGACRPPVSDGWIIKFFPYDKEGHRNTLTSITGSGMLPPQIVKVPVKYTEYKSDGSSTTEDLEFWAGFVGSSQNKNDFTLKPEIGWMIRK